MRPALWSAVLAPLALLLLGGTLLREAPGQAPGEPLPRVLPYPLLEPADYRAALGVTRDPAGRPTERYWQDRPTYALAARLDPETSILTGTAKLTYRNQSPTALRSVVLHLRQNLHKAGAQRTRDVEVTGGVEIDNVRVNGTELRRTPRVRDTRLTVGLPEPLATGESVTIEMDWSFDVPTAGRAPRMGHENADVFYLGYWYPQFAVHDDVEGWVADRYRGNGEFYMPYGDYDLSFTAPAGYLVRATGTLTNPEECLAEGVAARLAEAARSRDIVHVVTPADLEAGRVTAAGTDGLVTWRFRAENVRDVAVSCARTYLWDATHAKVEGRDDPVMIHAVYEPDATAWRGAAEAARHTIEYMSEMVYPYPWPHMTACEGIIGGGMEYPMMTIVGSSRSVGAVQGTIAHELIHMWFPMLVGSNEKRYAWQDEGFTSFWSALCTDDFRQRERGGQRAILSYVGTVTRGGDAVCMDHGDSYAGGGFGFASYSKCAAILHQLRGLVGDEKFFAAFRTYAEDWAFKHPYPWDFFRSFSHSTGQDLSWYFRTWYFETWTLDQAVAAVEPGADTSLVTVEDRGLAMHPTTVEVRYANGKTERKTIPLATWRSGRTADLTFAGGVLEVLIDPDFVTLDIDRENNAWKKEE